MYNNRLENNFVSGQDAEVIKRTRSERQSYEELAKEFREKLKSTISTSELEKLSKGTNASLKTIQSAILVQGTYMKQIAGSLKNIENMQKKILQASVTSFKAPTMKKVTDKDRLDIIGKSKGFTDFNKSVSDFGSSLNKLIEAQKSNNNEVLAALGMVPKNTSDIITKAFGKFLLDNPRMVMLFKFLDRTIGTGARWIFDLGKELGQFDGGFFRKTFGLLSLRQRGAWTNEINYNPAMPLQSIMSTLNAIHKNVWIMNHDESVGGKKKSSELYMEKGGLKAFLDQIPAHYKRIAAAFLGISAAYWPSATAQIGLWLPKIAARTVAGIFTNKAVWGAFTTFLRSPLLSLTVASSLNTAWESIFTRNRERRDERERERRTRETDRNSDTRRFVAGRNSVDNDAWFDNHDRSRGYGAYILEEIRNGYNKFWERGISKTVGNIWDAMFNQSALRAKRSEAEDKDREKYYNDIRYRFLDMINEPAYRTNIEYFISNAQRILQNSIEVIPDIFRDNINYIPTIIGRMGRLSGAIGTLSDNIEIGADTMFDAIMELRNDLEVWTYNNNLQLEAISDNTNKIREALYDAQGDSWLRDIQASLDTLGITVTNPIVEAINNISGTGGGNNGNITLGNLDDLSNQMSGVVETAIYGARAAFNGSGDDTLSGMISNINTSTSNANMLLALILKTLRISAGKGLSGDELDRVPGLNTNYALKELLEHADAFNDAMIGPNGEKIADPFGKANDSASGNKRQHPPILVQEDGKGGVDLSIFDRGDNIIAVQNGSPMSQAIYALRNMSPEQLKQIIETVGGFASNVLTIKGHPVLGGMMNAATMTGSGLVSVHQFINSDYTSLYKHEDAFGNTYETKSLLTADVGTVVENVAKGVGKGGQAIVKGIFRGGKALVKGTFKAITAPFSFMKSLFTGSFKKNFSESLTNIAKFFKSKITWDNIKGFFSLSNMFKASWTYFVKKPYQLISTALSKSIDAVHDKIAEIGSKISGTVIDSFIKDKAKNTAMLGGFGIMGALPVLLQNFGGDFGKGITGFLNSDMGGLITSLLETFGGKFGGFVSALRMGGEFNNIIEDFKKNGFDMNQLGDASWVGSKAIIGSLASIVFGPQAMGIVNGTMDLAKDLLSWMYSDAMDKLTEQWGEFMHQWDTNGLFGGNTARAGMKAAVQTLAMPFGQTAMDIVGDWSDSVNDWIESKIENAIAWWKNTKDWLSDEFKMIPTRLGGLAYDIIGPALKYFGDVWNSLLEIPKWFDKKINNFLQRIAKGLEGTWFEKLGKTLADTRQGINEWAYDKITFDIDSLRKYKVASDLNTYTEYIDKDMIAKYDANFGKTTDTGWLHDLGRRNGNVYQYDEGSGLVKSTKSKAGIGGALQTLNAKTAVDMMNQTGLSREAVSVARRICQFTGMPFSSPFVHVCAEYMDMHDKSLKASAITDRKSASEVLAKINKMYPGMMNELAETPEERSRIGFALANMLEGEGAEYYKTAKYIDQAVNKGLLNVSDAYSFYDYQMENKDIRRLKDLKMGSDLKAMDITFDNDAQKKAVLAQMTASKYSLKGKSIDVVKKEVEAMKGAYDAEHMSKLEGAKKQFVEGFKKFMTSKEFRGVLAENILKGGNEGLKKFSDYIAKGIVSVADSCGYPITGDDAQSLESVINTLIDKAVVSIAKMAGAKDPESYKGFAKAKWIQGYGYVVNLSEDIVQKFRSFSLSDLYDKISSDVKKMNFKSPIMKASNMIGEKISPYLSTAKNKLSEGADMFKGFISNLFGQIGLGDMFSGLSSFIPSLSGLFGGGSSGGGGFLGGLFGGGDSGSIQNSPEAKVFAQQAADFTKTDKFRQKIKARYGTERYNKWIADDQKYLCARGLKEVLREQGVLSNAEANRGGDAHEMDKLFDGHEGFQNVTDIVKKNNINPASLPPGYVVIMDKSSKHKNGHVFMTMGNGMEVSDHVQKMNPDYRKSNYGGIKRVYAIKKAGYGGDITSIENELTQSGAMPAASSSSASAPATSNAPSAIPTAPYTTGVATVLPNESPETVSDESLKKITGDTGSMIDWLKSIDFRLKSLGEKGVGTTVIAPDNSTVVNNSSTVNSSNNVDNSGAANNSDRYASMRDYQNMGFQFASSILQ